MIPSISPHTIITRMIILGTQSISCSISHQTITNERRVQSFHIITQSLSHAQPHQNLITVLTAPFFLSRKPKSIQVLGTGLIVAKISQFHVFILRSSKKSVRTPDYPPFTQNIKLGPKTVQNYFKYKDLSLPNRFTGPLCKDSSFQSVQNLKKL